MAKRRNRPVNYDRLRAALENHGTNVQKAGIDLGHADSYLYKVDYIGYLGEIEILGLKSLYGIEYDEIKPMPKPEPKPEPTPEPTPEPKSDAAPALSMIDRILLEKMTDAITKLGQMVNNQAVQTKALTEAIQGIEERTKRLDTLLNQPHELYKAIFVPTYNAIKNADLERAEAEERAKKDTARRLDGSIDYSKLKR